MSHLRLFLESTEQNNKHPHLKSDILFFFMYCLKLKKVRVEGTETFVIILILN